MDVSSKNIGNRIKELRLANGYTQSQLAEKSNLHTSYIGIVERGVKNISVKALNDILTSLNTSLIEFFRPFDEMNSDIKEDELYNQILLPLQTLSKDDKNKVLEIIKLAILLGNK